MKRVLINISLVLSCIFSLFVATATAEDLVMKFPELKKALDTDEKMTVYISGGTSEFYFSICASSASCYLSVKDDQFDDALRSSLSFDFHMSRSFIGWLVYQKSLDYEKPHTIVLSKKDKGAFKEFFDKASCVNEGAKAAADLEAKCGVIVKLPELKAALSTDAKIKIKTSATSFSICSSSECYLSIHPAEITSLEFTPGLPLYADYTQMANFLFELEASLDLVSYYDVVLSKETKESFQKHLNKSLYPGVTIKTSELSEALATDASIAISISEKQIAICSPSECYFSVNIEQISEDIMFSPIFSDYFLIVSFMDWLMLNKSLDRSLQSQTFSLSEEDKKITKKYIDTLMPCISQNMHNLNAMDKCPTIEELQSQ